MGVLKRMLRSFKSVAVVALACSMIFAILTAVSLAEDDNSSLTGELNASEFDTSSINTSSLDSDISTMTKSGLTQAELDGIVYMREEEKLARDVYLEFAESYNMPIFTNIASSEQTHMDAVGTLLARYDIQDPASPDRGVFNDEGLQAAYDDLIASGSVSLVDALRAGAKIEEMDILDLEDHMSETSKDDIIVVYSALMRGSRNHLRSFVSTLSMNGVTYSPVLLSEDEYQDIVNSPHERGPYFV